MSGSGGPEVLGSACGPHRNRAPATCWCASRPPASTGPISCSGRASIRRRQGPRTSSGSSWPARSNASAQSVSRWKPGDRVCALVAGGAYAEYASSPNRRRCRSRQGSIPSTPRPIPETYFTVWTNLFQRGTAAEGERVLVHGGTSGIGTTAIQLGARLRRARARDCGLGRQVRRVRTARRRSDQLPRAPTSSKRSAI